MKIYKILVDAHREAGDTDAHWIFSYLPSNLYFGIMI